MTSKITQLKVESDNIIKYSIKLTENGLFHEARELMREAISDSPDANLLKEAARVVSSMTSYNEAIGYLKDAAELENHKNAETYSDMARCVYRYGDKERNKTEGMEYAKKALSINQYCANAWLNKGNFHQDAGFAEQAKECYDKALTYNKELSGAYNNLGNLLYQENKFEDSCFQFLNGLNIDPQDEDIL